MSDRKKQKARDARAVGRRAFLRNTGLGAGALGAAALSLTGGGSKPAAAAAGEATGYRETPHIKKYYELAKKF